VADGKASSKRKNRVAARLRRSGGISLSQNYLQMYVQDICVEKFKRRSRSPMIRDRDRIYGAVVTCRLCAMGIRDKPTAPASPNGFAERLIRSGVEFLRRLTAARARSLINAGTYAETWGNLMNIPPPVPLNWDPRRPDRCVVVADEQKTINLYSRSGLIKDRLSSEAIVDRSFSAAIEEGAGL
jgi:hypothetical protein